MSDSYDDDWGSVGFSADTFDAEEAENGGGFVDREGKYHFEITSVKWDPGGTSGEGDNQREKSPCVKFHMTVLHSVKGQSPAGASFIHRLYFTDKEGAQKNIIKFGLRLGLLVKRDGRAIDPATGTTRITPALFKRAEGLQCIGEVKSEKYEGKDQFKIPFSEVFHPHDPKVASVPKCPNAMALLGQASAPSSGTASTGSSTATATKRAPAVEDEFADL